MRRPSLVRSFLIALAVGCVPRLAAPQAPLPSFALIDNFDEEAHYVPSPTSSGIVRTEKQIGRDETPGLFFRGSGLASRAAAAWVIDSSAGRGYVFWVKALSGDVSVNVRLVEQDGDYWSAWAPAEAEWSQIILPFNQFEFVAQGNGSREATKIKRIEIEAVLTGDQKVKACVVDELGTVSREEAERFGPTWDYFRGLVKVLQALPLDDKKPQQNIQTRVMKISEAPASEYLKVFTSEFSAVLDSLLKQAGQLDERSKAAEQSSGWPAGRAAQRALRQARAYWGRLKELAQRQGEFGLDFRETESALSCSYRMLDAFQSTLTFLAQPRTDGVSEPIAPLSGGGAPGRRERILLNGSWDFQTRPRIGDPPGDAWGQLPVPHGFWGQTLGQVFPVPAGADRFMPCAWMRKQVWVPPSWAGSRMALSFNGAGHWVDVYVNGLFCGTHIGGFDPFEVDVSRALRPGQINTILVMTADSSSTALGKTNPLVAKGVYRGVRPGAGPNSYLAMGGPEMADAGIWDDVALECSPAARIQGVAIRTSVKQNTIDAELLVANSGSANRSLRASADVLLEGKVVLSLPPQALDVAAGQTGKAALSSAWKNYKPWGPGPPYGTPTLYRLRMRLEEGGHIVDERVERFGFREFEAVSTGFFLNGQRIQLQGDTVSASSGGATWERSNPWYFEQYLRLARAANVNFVKLQSEFPQSWLDLCDEMGMLCAPQAPIQGLVSRAPDDLYGLDDYEDPFWLQNAEEQMAGWACGHLNHPSVIFRIPESGTFSEDLFWAHGKGAPSQARKTRDRLEAAFAIDRAIRKVDSSLPIVHMDNAFGDADSRFEVCSWRAPFASEEWRRRVKGRPLIAEIDPPAALPQFEDLRVADREGAGQALDRLSGWLRDATAMLVSNGVSAVVMPDVQSGLFSTARRDLMGPWQSMTPESLKMAPRIHRLKAPPLVRLNMPIPVVWPALSGTGLRAATFDLADGASTYVNWFDPKAPVATPNMLYSSVRAAFAACPPLGEVQRSEALVDLGARWAGATVVLTPDGEVAAGAEGAVADQHGRAWLLLKSAGRYRMQVQGGAEQTVEIPAPPATAARPGYLRTTVIRGGGN